MKWTVGTKIGGGFAFAVLALLVICISGYLSTRQLIETNHTVAQTHLALEELENVLSALKDGETGQRGYLITGNPKYLDPYNTAQDRADKLIEDLRGKMADPSDLKRLDDLQALIKTKFTELQQTIDLRKDKTDESFHAAQAIVLNDTGKEAMDKMRGIVGEMEKEERSLLDQKNADAESSAAFTKYVILIGGPLAAVALAIVGYLITVNISRPLGRMTVAADRIATGDLSAKLDADERGDEVGVLSRTFVRMSAALQSMATVAGRIAAGDLKVDVSPQSDKDVLGTAFATMTRNLRQIMADLAEGANVLGSASAQIVASTTELAAGSVQTASAVTETTSTVEEVRQTSQISSEKAKYVSESAQRAAAISESGKKTTDDAVEGMGRIRQQMSAIADSMVKLSEQTQAIGQIIATVDDLSQQSNLLAVNASIEAAKAGEQGKGFAVVAQEVRSLAAQSKGATTQVRTILSDIQKATAAAAMATEQGTKAVEAGVRQSGEAGNSILKLAGGVNEAAEAAGQIAASSEQQLAGMEQVATAMESIKQASTQNVDSARQLETAARNLERVGQRLTEMVGRYKV
jgi:methyl-accepting chemotaxis protein